MNTHYEVYLRLGCSEFKCRCDTIIEAYTCIDNITKDVPCMRINLDAIMETLVEMWQGKIDHHATPEYAIYRRVEDQDEEV